MQIGVHFQKDGAVADMKQAFTASQAAQKPTAGVDQVLELLGKGGTLIATFVTIPRPTDIPRNLQGDFAMIDGVAYPYDRNVLLKAELTQGRKSYDVHYSTLTYLTVRGLVAVITKTHDSDTAETAQYKLVNWQVNPNE